MIFEKERFLKQYRVRIHSRMIFRFFPRYAQMRFAIFTHRFVEWFSKLLLDERRQPVAVAVCISNHKWNFNKRFIRYIALHLKQK